MTTRQQRLISKILGEKAPQEDHSLRAKALDRALNGGVPRTLTPWEWEEWYATHGQPEAHRASVKHPVEDTRSDQE